MKPAPVLLFAVGNASRGDDALAPMLLRSLEPWLASRRLDGEIELLEDFQLQIEHALDMRERRLVLFVDAGMATPGPYTFGRVMATEQPQLYTHALTPDALLAVFRQIHQAEPPDSYVLCIRGEAFELGEGLSPEAEAHLKAAWQFIMTLLKKPTPEYWRHLACDPVPGKNLERLFTR